MNKHLILQVSLFALIAFLLASCSGAATPTAAPAPTKAANTTSPTISEKSSSFESKSNSGGSVDVDVKPTALKVGEPVAFEIAMNTHSVDLSDDMTKITTLRDDTGKEYAPTAWDGPGGGGHHRSGTIKFAALTGKPKSVELIIKGLAGVTERVFKWDLP